MSFFFHTSRSVGAPGEQSPGAPGPGLPELCDSRSGWKLFKTFQHSLSHHRIDQSICIHPID